MFTIVDGEFEDDALDVDNGFAAWGPAELVGQGASEYQRIIVDGRPQWVAPGTDGLPCGSHGNTNNEQMEVDGGDPVSGDPVTGSQEVEDQERILRRKLLNPRRPRPIPRAPVPTNTFLGGNNGAFNTPPFDFTFGNKGVLFTSGLTTPAQSAGPSIESSLGQSRPASSNSDKEGHPLDHLQPPPFTLDAEWFIRELEGKSNNDGRSIDRREDGSGLTEFEHAYNLPPGLQVNMVQMPEDLPIVVSGRTYTQAQLEAEMARLTEEIEEARDAVRLAEKQFVSAQADYDKSDAAIETEREEMHKWTIQCEAQVQAEIKAWQERVTRLEELNKRNEGKLQDLDQEKANLQQERANFQQQAETRIHALEQELENLQQQAATRVQALEQDVQNAHQERATLQQQAEERVQALVQDVQNTQQEKATFQQQAQTRVQALEQDLQNVQQEKATNQEDARVATQSRLDCERTRRDMEVVIGENDRTIRIQQDEIADLTARNSQASPSIVINLQGELEEANKKYETSQQNWDESRLEVQRLDEANRDLQSQVRVLKNVEREHLQQLDGYDKSLIEKDKETTKLRSDLQAAQSHVKKLTQENDTLQERVEQSNRAAKDQAQLLKQHDALVRKVEELKNAKSEVASLQEALQQQGLQFDELHQQYLAGVDRIKELESENVGLNAEMTGNGERSNSPQNRQERTAHEELEDLYNESEEEGSADYRADDGTGPCPVCDCPRVDGAHADPFELAATTQQLKEAKEAKELAESERDAKKGQYEGARKDLGAANGKIESVSMELAKAIDDVINLNNKLGEVNSKLATLTSERDAANLQLRTVTTERDGLNRRLAAITTELESATGRLADVTTERDDATEKLEAITELRDGLEERLAIMTRDLDRARADSSELKVSRDTLQAMVQELTGSLNDTNAERDATEVTAKGLQQDLSAMKVEQTRLQEELSTRERDRATGTDQQDSLTRDLNAMSKDRDLANANIANMKKLHDDFQVRLAEAQQQLDQANTTLALSSQARDGLEKSVASLTGERDRARAEQVRQEQETKAMTTLRDDLQTALNDMRRLRDELQNALKAQGGRDSQEGNIVTLLATSTMERDDAMAMQGRLEAERDQLATDITNMTALDNDLQKRLDVITRSRDGLQSDVDVLKNERDNLQGRVNRRTTERDTARDERDSFRCLLDHTAQERDSAIAIRDSACPHCNLLRTDPFGTIPEGGAHVPVYVRTQHLNPISCFFRVYISIFLLFITWLGNLKTSFGRLVRRATGQVNTDAAAASNVVANKEPSVVNIIASLATHLVGYGFLYAAFVVYCEREVWLGANTAAASQLIAAFRRNTGSHSVLEHIFPRNVLPPSLEDFRHFVEVWLQVDRALPG